MNVVEKTEKRPLKQQIKRTVAILLACFGDVDKHHIQDAVSEAYCEILKPRSKGGSSDVQEHCIDDNELIHAARNNLIDFIRRCKTRDKHSEDVGTLEELRSTPKTPLEILEQQELGRVIWQAIEDLTLRQEKVLRDRMDGVPRKETASDLGVSGKTVQREHSAALAKLRRRLSILATFLAAILSRAKDVLAKVFTLKGASLFAAVAISIALHIGGFYATRGLSLGKQTKQTKLHQVGIIRMPSNKSARAKQSNKTATAPKKKASAKQGTTAKAKPAKPTKLPKPTTPIKPTKRPRRAVQPNQAKTKEICKGVPKASMNSFFEAGKKSKANWLKCYFSKGLKPMMMQVDWQSNTILHQVVELCEARIIRLVLSHSNKRLLTVKNKWGATPHAIFVKKCGPRREPQLIKVGRSLRP